MMLFHFRKTDIVNPKMSKREQPLIDFHFTHHFLLVKCLKAMNVIENSDLQTELSRMVFAHVLYIYPRERERVSEKDIVK